MRNRNQAATLIRTMRQSGPARGPGPTDEARAVQIAFDGTAVQRLTVAARALGRLLRNPEDTRQVFVLNVLLNRDHIPTTMLRFVTAPGGLALLHDQPAIDSSTVDLQAMARLPAGTLGHAYAHHLLGRGLDGDIFQAPPGVPPAVAYLAQRARQSHDLWHVLTGYATDVPGEIALQGFTYGQLGAPGPGVTALVGAIRWGVANPRVVRLAWDGYQRGKRAKYLLAVRWEDLWEMPLTRLREDLAIPPARVT